MAIEIVDLPSKMVDLSIAMLNYQRVTIQHTPSTHILDITGQLDYHFMSVASNTGRNSSYSSLDFSAILLYHRTFWGTYCSYGHLLVITGYFNGIIQSINGVLLVLITGITRAITVGCIPCS